MPATAALPDPQLPAVQQRLLELARRRSADALAMVDLLVDADGCGGPPVDALLAVDAGLGLRDRRDLRTSRGTCRTCPPSGPRARPARSASPSSSASVSLHRRTG